MVSIIPILFGILSVKSFSDFLQRSQTSVEALWSLRSIDLRVIALHLSIVKLRMPQNASLVPLISEPIRVFPLWFTKGGVCSIPNKIRAGRHYNKRHTLILFVVTLLILQFCLLFKATQIYHFRQLTSIKPDGQPFSNCIR